MMLTTAKDFLTFAPPFAQDKSASVSNFRLSANHGDRPRPRTHRSVKSVQRN